MLVIFAFLYSLKVSQKDLYFFEIYSFTRGVGGAEGESVSGTRPAERRALAGLPPTALGSPPQWKPRVGRPTNCTAQAPQGPILFTK